jgi:hypothetical protein
MARGFDDVNPSGGNRDDAKLDEIFDLFVPSRDAKGEYVTLRFLPTSILPIKKHWIQIMGGKEGAKRAVGIPVMCVGFDPDNEDVPLEGRECPYCNLPHGKKEDGYPAQEELKYLANVIVRDLQTDEPKRKEKPTKKEKETGYKDIKSKTWSPVRVCVLPPGATRRLRELGSRNIPKKGKKTGKGLADGKTAFPVNHPRYGLDIDIKYNEKAAGSEKYSIEKQSVAPLTDEEKGYLVWNLEDWETLYDASGRQTTKEAKGKLKRMDVIGMAVDNDSDSDEDDDEGSSKSKSRKLGSKDKSKGKGDKDKAKSKKPKSRDDDDDDDDDDGEPAKKVRKLGASKSGKSSKSDKSEKSDKKKNKVSLKSVSKDKSSKSDKASKSDKSGKKSGTRILGKKK